MVGPPGAGGVASASTSRQFPLLEREVELARITALLDGVDAGAGGALLAHGQPGVGKSALCDAAVAMARSRGMLALRARGEELGQDLGWGVVRELFEPALSEVDADEAELFAGGAGFARPVLARGSAPARSTDPLAAATQGLYWLMANLAVERAILVVV